MMGHMRTGTMNETIPTVLDETVQLSSKDGMIVSPTNGAQMTNDRFYSIPGIGEISYFKGVPQSVLDALVTWVDGDSSVGDCEIGYDGFEDTFTGTFTGGQTVLFDHEVGVWYES
jgi:hypothetical protein